MEEERRIKDDDEEDDDGKFAIMGETSKGQEDE